MRWLSNYQVEGICHHFNWWPLIQSLVKCYVTLIFLPLDLWWVILESLNTGMLVCQNCQHKVPQKHRNLNNVFYLFIIIWKLEIQHLGIVGRVSLCWKLWGKDIFQLYPPFVDHHLSLCLCSVQICPNTFFL